MLRYFVAGNGWLLAAFVLIVGCGDAPGDGRHEYWSFLKVGRVAAELYLLVVAAAFGLAAWNFLVYRRTLRRGPRLPARPPGEEGEGWPFARFSRPE
jgi:hypothetical protein